MFACCFGRGLVDAEKPCQLAEGDRIHKAMSGRIDQIEAEVVELKKALKQNTAVDEKTPLLPRPRKTSSSIGVVATRNSI